MAINIYTGKAYNKYVNYIDVGLYVALRIAQYMSFLFICIYNGLQNYSTIAVSLEALLLSAAF